MKKFKSTRAQRIEKLTKGVFVLNGMLFLLGGISVIGDDKVIFLVLQFLGALLNFALLLKINNKRLLEKLDFSVLAINIALCIFLGIESIQQH